MAFTFIYGNDEYLLEQEGVRAWAGMSVGLDAQFGLEVIDGRALRVEDVVALVNRTRGATQTLGLFGGGRAVWVRSVNFLVDSVVGRAEGTALALEELKPILTAADPAQVKILITATPVDKRLSFFKWLTSNGTAREVADLEGLDSLGLGRYAQAKGLVLDEGAAELFLKKVGSNARSVEGELEKLSLYLDASPAQPQRVTEDLVIEMTSDLAEGESFFEPVEAFYSRKKAWALEAMRRYFDPHGAANDARPILAAFMNRNRLLLMLKAAEAAGLAKVSPRGITWTAAANPIKEQFGADKTPFNLFAQNPWYLGKLAQEAARWQLNELANIQNELADLFEAIHGEVPQGLLFEGFCLRHMGA